MVSSKEEISLGLMHEVEIMGRKVGAGRAFWTRLSEDEKLFGRVVALAGNNSHPEPTITPIEFRIPDGSLVQMRDGMKLDGYVNSDFNDGNFPVDVRGDREFVLVCFNRDVDDDEDSEKSELLRELDNLGLQPEGPPELCGLGTDHPDLQRKFPIVARRQLWRNPRGRVNCPVLFGGGGERSLSLDHVRDGWDGRCRFLASRK